MMSIQFSQNLRSFSHFKEKGCFSRVSLKPFTTLKAGGEAEWFYTASFSDQLSRIAAEAHQTGIQMTILGSGSNILPSDKGVPSAVVMTTGSPPSITATTEFVVPKSIPTVLPIFHLSLLRYMQCT